MRLIQPSEKAMTEKQKNEAIDLIKDLKDFSLMDDMIEDWKKEDEMDGPLSWALCLRQRINDFLKEMEA
jgi:hypothetical protein